MESIFGLQDHIGIERHVKTDSSSGSPVDPIKFIVLIDEEQKKEIIDEIVSKVLEALKR